MIIFLLGAHAFCSHNRRYFILLWLIFFFCHMCNNIFLQFIICLLTWFLAYFNMQKYLYGFVSFMALSFLSCLSYLPSPWSYKNIFLNFVIRFFILFLKRKHLTFWSIWNLFLFIGWRGGPRLLFIQMDSQLWKHI